MDELRSMYELPYLINFICAKRDQFKFPAIDVRTFEASIWDSDSKLFEYIVCRILRSIKKSTDISISSCEQHLKAFAEEQKPDFTGLVKDDWKSITAADKLKILKLLADKTKEKKNDLDDMLSNEFGVDGTIINAGQDSENRTYWYFDDLRLYRQKKGGHSKTGCDWQCLATDCDSWETLIKQFSQSTDEQERDLHNYLTNELYSAIKPLLQTQPSEPKRISNEELLSLEEKDMVTKDTSGATAKAPSPAKMDQSEMIRNENPELSKVLSEEPSTGKSGGQVDADKKAAANGGVTFTQSHSQLFVFSTQMANKAADAVISGSHPSILHYHLDDVDTKNFLRANSMTATLPSPQSRLPMPPQRPTNPFRQPKRAPLPGHTPPMQWPGSMKAGVPSTCNQPMMARGPRMPGSPCGVMPGYMNNDMKGGMHPLPGQPMPGRPMSQPDIGSHCVPNENLTPDQLQHREDSLANLRKLQKFLMADDGGNNVTDYSHIRMAQDRQGPYPPQCSQSPNNFPNHAMNPLGANAPPNAAGMSMSSAGMPGPMESKPPPPYPMPSSGTPVPPTTASTTTTTKKSSRKRKPSVAPSASPASPLDPPNIKSEKQMIPPSPLAAQSSAPSQGGPKAPAHITLPKSEDGFNNGQAKGQMSLPLGRQHSLPNFPPGQSPGSYRMMQAGQPTPYQNSPMAGLGGDAPPSYNHSLRRGMSVESMTVPPTQQQQYLQPENQERIIERQLNASHQSKLPGQPDTPMSFNNTPPPLCNSYTSAGDSELTNITSAPLANLTKGVEQNISELSQKMNHGGPYGGMQPSSNPEPGAEQTGSMPLPTSAPSSNHQQPSINNTFVNAHMSIGQVNIQNVTANQTYQGPGMPGQMQQHVDVSMNNFAGGVPAGPQPDPMYKPAQPATPAVSIQNKGRNTIQYLPVSQPSIAPSHDPAVPLKQNFDFGSAERFPSPTPNFLPTEGMHMSAGSQPRHPSAMYSTSMPAPMPQGGTVMPSGAPMPMGDSIPRGPSPQFMMSAQQSSMSLAYNPSPTTPGHPGMVESHMHMRNQHLLMSGPGAAPPGMHPPSHAPMANYPPSGPGAPPGTPMPYGPPGPEYMGNPPGHPMPPRNMVPSQQPMMMSHHGNPAYMGNPPAGPPYM